MRPIRIVVGEGRTAQRGLLRFVLEGEGFEVVGETQGSAELPEILEDQQPDVVVLDDGIGATAVSMVHDVAPEAKVVLVWPSAVVPIGGDARVEPAKILRDLGPAVQRVTAASPSLTQSFVRPDWIDRIRKDPATLRSKLGGTKPSKRPSVTRLQRRGRRLHPSRESTSASDPREDAVPAPVVVLPVDAAGAEPVLDLAGGSAGAVEDEPYVEPSEWNRRLGTLAMSGAAAVSALVLALALGGRLVGISSVRGGGQLPVGVRGFESPGVVGTPGSFGPGSLGEGHYVPSTDGDTDTVGPGPGNGSGQGGLGFDGSVDGGFASPGTGGTDEPAPSVDPGDGDTGGGDGGGGDGGGGDGGGGNGGGGNGGGGNGGGDGGNGGNAPDSTMPGRSAEHNPHGGPPGQMGLTPAHGPGLGIGHGNGNGNGNGHQAEKHGDKHAHKG